jgi:large subunit ribosomal protein L29
MSLKELKELSVEGLQAEKTKILSQQFAFRMQKGMGESVKPHLIKQYRRNIARIETILNEKNRKEISNDD